MDDLIERSGKEDSSENDQEEIGKQTDKWGDNDY